MLARTLAFLMLFLAGSPLACADIVISNYTHATNDRFTNSSSFLLNGFNLSGVGKTASGRWATLIDRDIVVSAFHAAPNSEIYFYANNNPATIPVIRQVAMSTRIGTSDLWIGKLTTAVDASISHFNIATEVLNGTAQTSSTTIALNLAGSYQQAVGVLTGQSPATGQPLQQDQAFGQNRIFGFAKSFIFNGGITDTLITTIDQANSGDYIDFEATLVGGDSGAPLFVVDGSNSLTLLGVNSFILTNDVTKATVANGMTYVGNYLTPIQNFKATAVPEPSSIAVIVFTASVFWSRRLMRRKVSNATL